MSKTTDRITAQANANATQVYIDQLEVFEQAIIKDRNTIRDFLKDHAQLKEVLIVNDNGMVYVPAKKKGQKDLNEPTAEMTEEPEVNANGRGARRRTSKAAEKAGK